VSSWGPADSAGTWGSRRT